MCIVKLEEEKSVSNFREQWINILNCFLHVSLCMAEKYFARDRVTWIILLKISSKKNTK